MRKAWEEANQGSGRAALPKPTDFEILGLGPDATMAEIKKAHRKMAMKHHPDMGGEAAQFRALQEAYENLKALAW